MSNGIGRVWAVNAEGGDEGRPNGVGPVWIENADQLGSKLPEPESGDAGKVLGVLNSDGDIGWVPDQEGMAQVQADWDQADSSQVSYIANKPTLATVATSGAYADLSGKPTIPTVDQVYDASSANAQSGVAVASAISGKQDTISDLETIRSGAAAGATAVQPSSLATVATTGSYTDLQDKPSIPAAQVNSDWNASSGVSQILNKPSLATVATSGSYADLSNKPTIPAAQVNADWNSSSGVSEILNKPTLATVATSGSYADLSNKPTIPTVDQNYSASSANAQSGTAVAQAIAAIPAAPTYTAGNGIDIENDEISVKAGTGLEIGTSSGTITTQTVGLTQHINSGNYDSVNVIQPLTPEIFAAIGNNTASITLGTVPVTDSDFTNWTISGGSGETAYVVIGKLAERTSPNSGWSIDTTKAMYLGVAVQSLDANGAVPTNVAYNVHASDNTDYDSTLTWSELTTAQAGGTLSDYAIFIARKATSPAIGVYPSTAMSSHITGVVDGQIATGSITYTATITGALNVSNPLPASTSADEDKVLTVNSSGTPVWAAAQGGSSYTDGTGIHIDSGNRISVNPDSTLKGVYNEWSYNVTAMTNAGTYYPSYIDVHSQEELEYVLNSFPVDSSIKVSVQTGEGIYNDAVPQSADIKAYLIVSSDTNFNSFYVNPVEMSASYDTTNNRWVLEPQTVEAKTPASTHGWVPVGTPSGTLRYVSFAFGTSFRSLTPSTVARQDTLIPETIAIVYPGFSDPMKIGVATPLPAPAVGDFDKVLKVSPSLNAEWATLALGSVTSIQQVNSLPANPDANTLYLIPEA